MTRPDAQTTEGGRREPAPTSAQEVTGLGTPICPVCGQKFNSETALAQHKREAHNA